MRRPRSERYAAVKPLKDAGWSARQISGEVGLSESYVRRLLDDPSGDKKRAQRVPCKDPFRQRRLRERRMGVTTRTLADAGPRERWAAAQRVCCEESSSRSRYRVLAVALWPDGFPQELARYVEDIIEGEAAALLEPVAA